MTTYQFPTHVVRIFDFWLIHTAAGVVCGVSA